jgi:H+/Cl- antiporter ClcA
MADPDPDAEASADDSEPSLGLVLHGPGYLSVLAIASLLGIPLSLVAFAFLAVVHELEHLIWETLPDELGYNAVPAWWPVLAVGLAGVLVGLVVQYFPGKGGHVPVNGFSAEPTQPSAVPGVMLAALAGLPLGAVIGPEAPLLAMGGGLALFAIRRTPASGQPQAAAVISATGSAVAISAIFGNPLVAAIFFLELVGLARRRALLLLLPVLLASGIGAIVFVGLGDWTGLTIGSLGIPDLTPEMLRVEDLLWTLPIAAVVGLVTLFIFRLGGPVAALATRHPLRVTPIAGLLVGTLAATYALVTDHPPTDVVLSGQATLVTLADEPAQWTAGALVVLLLCKGLAFALSLGAFRGGPIFPAVFLGAATGVLASDLLPGLGSLAGLGIGMAASVAAVIRLPVSSVLLVILILGDAAIDLMPVIILAAVVAIVFEEWLSKPGLDASTSAPVAATRSAEGN